MTGKKNKERRKRMYGDRNYGDRKWEERIQKKEGIILKEMKETNVIRSSCDFMKKGMKTERKEKKQETRKKRLGRVLRRGFG